MNDSIRNHELAGHYNKLTPDRVLDAVEANQRRCTGRFLILNSYENRVYQMELEDGSWLVGKFYRPGRWSRETILAEHAFLAELAEEEIPVALPLELEPGCTLGEVDGILYSLFDRMGGRVADELTDELTRIVGRYVARIHNVGATKETEHRIRLDVATYGRQNLETLLKLGAIPPEVRRNFEATAHQLFSRIDTLIKGVPFHRIHGDCHLGNLILGRQGPIFLDFDDMVVGPAVQDIWMLVPSYDEYGQRQRQVLLEAYREFRDFNMSWLKLVEPLRALRYVHYSTWIARRWDDPIFPRTFPHFGTQIYWERELFDLREQIARIDHSAWD